MSQQKTQRINGTDYVYIDEPYWNADKKRGEHKRKYIGKMLGFTGVVSASSTPM